MSDLIDTTEMYLRTVFELEEEGIVPLRARIAERLHQSGPTVSQTVARMERDGLLTVEGDRHLELTTRGRLLATRVMRKHRLAERLLVDIIGLKWEHAHAEACRWEHVMSDEVERRLVDVLGHPVSSPYGNPIPGLSDLGENNAGKSPDEGLTRLSELPRGGPIPVVIRRLAEHVQADIDLIAQFRKAGAVPDAKVTAEVRSQSVIIGVPGHESVELPADLAHAVQVEKV